VFSFLAAAAFLFIVATLFLFCLEVLLLGNPSARYQIRLTSRVPNKTCNSPGELLPLQSSYIRLHVFVIAQYIS